MPRLYEPVWTQLKEEKEVSLSVHPAYYSRVKKAVIKEKDMDKAYKLEHHEEGYLNELVITYDKKARILMFKLVSRYNIEAI